MKVWFLLLVAWLCLLAPAWSQTPGAPPAAGTPLDSAGSLPPPSSEHRSLTAQEIGRSHFFSHDTSKTFDTDGSGTVTLFELGDALRKRITKWRSTPEAAEVSHVVAPTPQLKTPKSNVVGRSEANTQRSQYEAFRTRQMNESGSLPSVAPNIIEKRF